MEVGIINYGMGNVKSILNAVNILGFSGRIIYSPNESNLCHKLILPGVGAFKEGMQKLQSGGWDKLLQDSVLRERKPLMGICLGMQLLAQTGKEHGESMGLGLVSGSVEKLNVDKYPLPHIGWNTVKGLKGSLYNGINGEEDFYFVHSYVLVPEDENIISGICNYQVDFVASIESGCLFGTQYHPEKSQKAGLQVLKNFLEFKMG